MKQGGLLGFLDWLLTRLVVLALVGGAGLAAYAVGARLSSDAVGIVVGLLFGMVAIAPALLLQWFAARRARREEASSGYASPYPQLAAPPPVIIITGGEARQLGDRGQSAPSRYLLGQGSTPDAWDERDQPSHWAKPEGQARRVADDAEDYFDE